MFKDSRGWKWFLEKLVSGDHGRSYGSIEDSRLKYVFFQTLCNKRTRVASCTQLYSGTGCDNMHTFGWPMHVCSYICLVQYKQMYRHTFCPAATLGGACSGSLQLRVYDCPLLSSRYCINFSINCKEQATLLVVVCVWSNSIADAIPHYL